MCGLSKTEPTSCLDSTWTVACGPVRKVYVSPTTRHHRRGKNRGSTKLVGARASGQGWRGDRVEHRRSGVGKVFRIIL